MTEQQTEGQLQAAVSGAWADYLDRTARLGRDYEATVDAALVRLGQASADAYAAYDEQTALAFDVWQSATAQARAERDQAVNAAMAELEGEAREAVAQAAGM